MRTTLSVDRLRAVSELIVDKFGLHYPADRLREMERLLRRAAKTAGHSSVETYLDTLLAAPLPEGQFEVLARTLTIGETYFFRDPKIFELIGEHFLPGVLAGRPGQARQLRVWSAGCCTGEEAYTLAILFDRLRRLLPMGAPILLATDINQEFLQHARAGVYRSWSFRGSLAWLKKEYFTCGEGESFELRADIRRAVKFEPLNLAAFNYPAEENQTGSMDLILCRHVLMYFSPEQFARAVHQLAQCLVEGGWLVLSAAEVSHVTEPELDRLRIGDATVFVKRANRHRRPAAAARLWGQWECAPVVPPPLVPEPILAWPPAMAVPRGESEAARDEFAAGATPTPAVAAEPETADPLVIARLKASHGELAAALAICDRLVDEDKLNPVTHYLRATILQEQGVLAEAEAALKRVLYLEPDFIAAHISLANLARSRERFVEAGRHLRNALTLVERVQPNQLVPEAEGMTAGQLRGMLTSVVGHKTSSRPGQRVVARTGHHHRRVHLTVSA